MAIGIFLGIDFSTLKKVFFLGRLSLGINSISLVKSLTHTEAAIFFKKGVDFTALLLFIFVTVFLMIRKRDRRVP